MDLKEVFKPTIWKLSFAVFLILYLSFASAYGFSSFGGGKPPIGFPFNILSSKGVFSILGFIGDILIAYIASCIIIGFSDSMAKGRYWLKSILFSLYFFLILLLIFFIMMFTSRFFSLESLLDIDSYEFFFGFSLILTIPLLIVSIISIPFYYLFKKFSRKDTIGNETL